MVRTLANSAGSLFSPRPRRLLTDWPNCSDSELAKRCRSILLQMKMLSEGPASSALRGIDKISGYEDPSKPPRWTGSLFEEWLPKFARAEDDDALRTECLRAEIELAKYRGHYKAEMELPTDDKTAMERVVKVFEGVPPIEVARRLAGRVSPGWVELARRRHRRDVKTGNPLNGWRGWDDDRRKKEVRRALHSGMSQRETAKTLDAPRTTMQRIWDDELRAAA